MKPIIPLNQYGLLTVIKEVKDFKHNGHRYFKCVCSCGKKVITNLNMMRRGRTKSCGCLRKFNNLKHGQAKKGSTSREYEAWLRMKDRCLNKNNSRYKDWGGRGITIHQEWIESFESFFNYIGPRPSNLYSLDRIDNDGNYEPGNVRWTTIDIQNKNKRRSK